MKKRTGKILAVVLACMCIAFFTGCAEKSTDQTTAQNAASQTAQNAASTAAQNAAAEQNQAAAQNSAAGDGQTAANAQSGSSETGSSGTGIGETGNSPAAEVTDNTAGTISEQPAARENTDFRTACWGDNRETVKKYETAEVMGDTDDDLIYEGSVLGFSTNIIYQFDGDSLWMGAYSFTDTYSNPGQYISQYESIKKQLKKKYGKPKSDEVIPLAEQSLIDAAGEGQALEFGYVTYKAVWKKGDTDITLGMVATNYQITILIAYQNNTIEAPVDDTGL